MFQGYRCDPHVIDIDPKITQMPLGSLADCWRMCLPNTVHDLGVTVSSRSFYWSNKIEGIVFDEPPTLGASLGVCGIRRAKPPLNFG